MISTTGTMTDFDNLFDAKACMLCPRCCGADRAAGQRGRCGADDRILVGRAALHYWEEPPISGTAGSGAVFFAHCPLGCVYCQNAPLAHGQVGTAISVERLAQIFMDLQGQGALNINCVTPTHYAPWICEAVSLARQQGLRLPIVWNTSGYERAEVIDALASTVDVYLTDFKYGDSERAERYSRASDYPEVALQALERMVLHAGTARYDGYCGQKRLVNGVVVRHLLLPGGLDHSKRALDAVWQRFGNDVLYSLMSQYTPVLAVERDCGSAWAAEVLSHCPELAFPTAEAEYEALLDYADYLGIEDYFWQDGPAAAESFIPAWDGTGV